MVQANSQGSGGGISRRDFLKVTGAMGAGLVLAPTILAQEKGATPAGADDFINVALIGGGTQGRVLLEQTLKIKGIRVKAVCDIWPFNQKQAAGYIRTYGVDKTLPPIYVDYKEMLEKEKDLQAVIVATPDWMHAEHAIACMKAGLNVYCEKEMSNDLEKAKQMVLTSRETKKLLQIGHQRRSNPRYILCHDKIINELNLLKRITHINGQWNRSIMASGPRGFPKGQELDEATLKKFGYENMDQFRDWRWFKKYGGGPIADLGSHQIDIFGWFLGATPKSVMATGGLDYYKDKGWEMYDNVMALYVFDTPKGPVRAFYQTLSTTAARGYYESFMGTDGTLQISENPSMCRLFAEGHLTPEEDAETKKAPEHPWEPHVKKGYILHLDEPKPPATKAASMTDSMLRVYKSPPPTTFVPNIETDINVHQAHLQNFFDTVRGKGKLNCPGEIGYETAVQVLRVNEAVASGSTVTFKPEDFKI
jgi:predicted dehydrogenase